MKKRIGCIALLIFVGCKAILHNDRIISYDFVSPKNSFLKTEGDFQKLRFTKNDFIHIMPGYYRSYGSIDNTLIVRIEIKKKYSFENYGSVESKEFGKLKTSKHEWIKDSDENSSLLFVKSLSEVDITERKKRILIDTIYVKLGDLEYKFVPKKIK